MEHTFDFAILRLCPDPGRGEIVNVGLVIFAPGRLDVRLAQGLTKVAMISPDFDLNEVRRLEKLLPGFDDGSNNVAQRYGRLRDLGAIRLSPLGQFHAVGNEQYEDKVASLMRLLVVTRAPRMHASGTHLKSEINALLRGANLLGRDRDDADRFVVPNLVVDPSTGLTADYGLLNSKTYVAEAVEFTSPRRAQAPTKINEIGKAGYVFSEARRLFGNDTIRIVLISADAGTAAAASRTLNVISANVDHLWNFQSGEDKKAFLHMVRQAAHRTEDLH